MVLGIPATSTVCAGLLFGFWSSLGSGASLSARRVGLQVTMDGGGALQGTGVCVARAPYGARLPPLPAGESRDLPAAFASLRPQIAPLRTRARHMCARGAASPAAQVPTIGRASTSGCVQNPVWAGPGRRFVPVPRMSGIYDSQQGLSRHKQPDELNAVAKSLSPCPCCVCSGQARGEAGRAASGFLSHPPTLACVLFPGLVWGVTALHKIRS